MPSSYPPPPDADLTPAPFAAGPCEICLLYEGPFLVWRERKILAFPHGTLDRSRPREMREVETLIPHVICEACRGEEERRRKEKEDARSKALD